MISYEQFLQLADAEDIRVLNLLSQGQSLKFDNAGDADQLFARIERLDTAGFVIRASRHYERREGTMWQSFEALIDPVASTFVAKAASERVLISRDPLPTP